MSKEPLEAMPDVLNASQLADVLHLSRSGAYNLNFFGVLHPRMGCIQLNQA